MEQQPTQKSHRVLFVIVGAVILLAVVVGTVLYVIAGQNAKQTASTTTAPSPTPAVASKEQVKQNLSDLDTSIKQAQADQAAAQQAIKDSANETKIGS